MWIFCPSWKSYYGEEEAVQKYKSAKFLETKLDGLENN